MHKQVGLKGKYRVKSNSYLSFCLYSEEMEQNLKTLGEIEVILRDIKQNGRQVFLGKESNNFSRVVHDYADAKKGFVAWKGMLEEKLI